MRLSVRGGIHGIGMRGVDLSDGTRDKLAQAMADLQAKHEEKLLNELCTAMGWTKPKSAAAAAVRIAEENALRDADAKARREYRERRAKARV